MIFRAQSLHQNTSVEGPLGLNWDAQGRHAQPGSALPASDSSPQPGDENLSPRLRLHRAFQSQFLPDPRDVLVYLPTDYDRQPERAYPVLYLQDGQNLFDEYNPAIAGRTWAVSRHADAAIEAGEVEPLIIVGICNTGHRRLAEYTFEPDWQMGGGEAPAYGRLITEELMPWIASWYRVRAGRENTGVGGSSLGALVTLYMGLCYPQHFGKMGIVSPSVWWNRKSILGYVNDRASAICPRPRLWLDVGDQEGRPTLENAEQLNQHLITNGWQPGETLHFERMAGGTHDEASWALRVRPMLRFLFPAGDGGLGDAGD